VRCTYLKYSNEPCPANLFDFSCDGLYSSHEPHRIKADCCVFVARSLAHPGRPSITVQALSTQIEPDKYALDLRERSVDNEPEHCRAFRSKLTEKAAVHVQIQQCIKSIAWTGCLDRPTSLARKIVTSRVEEASVYVLRGQRESR
jgi:hypothetical protein